MLHLDSTDLIQQTKHIYHTERLGEKVHPSDQGLQSLLLPHYGPVAQSVASLIADPGQFPHQLHTFVEIHQEIFSTINLLLPLIQERLLLLTSISILKAIKNATGTSVIFHINNSLIHFVFVLTSVPNVGERFTKT